MLETKDIQTLFGHIKELHPHCPPDKIPRLTNSVADLWIRSFQGYSLEQLLRAADAHACTCRYWPSLSEIRAQLPALSAAEQMRLASIGPVERECMDESKKWQMKWHEELHALGLPTLREAIAAGTSLTRWRAMLSEAGVWEDK